MNIDIKLHKNDLPDDLELGNVLAVDGEFMGLNNYFGAAVDTLNGVQLTI